eukprot:7087057-Heterocapsa_arctica.AAC.1
MQTKALPKWKAPQGHHTSSKWGGCSLAPLAIHFAIAPVMPSSMPVDIPPCSVAIASSRCLNVMPSKPSGKPSDSKNAAQACNCCLRTSCA